jgi:tetratricopeptide (TPR) repeat protein
MYYFGFLGSLLLLIAGFSSWVNSSIFPTPPGLGIIALTLLLGMVAFAGTMRKSSNMLVCSGIIALGLAGYVLLDLSFSQNLLEKLTSENDQYLAIVNFNKTNFVPNFNAEPALTADLPVGGLLERCGSAFHFLGRGWWLCLTGAILLSGVFASTVSTRMLAILVLPVIAGATVLLIAGLTTQSTLEKARLRMSAGDYRQAAALNRQAFDRTMFGAPTDQTMLAIGECLLYLGETDAPETLFFSGNRMFLMGNYELATTRLTIAYETASGSLRSAIARLLAKAYAQIGLEHFQNARFGAANAAWEKSLTFDHEQHQSHFYLIRGYSELKDFDHSLEHCHVLLKRSGNRFLRAAILAGIGDNLWEKKLFNEARAAYYASLQEDSKGNLRITKNLGGT